MHQEKSGKINRKAAGVHADRWLDGRRSKTFELGGGVFRIRLETEDDLPRAPAFPGPRDRGGELA